MSSRKYGYNYKKPKKEKLKKITVTSNEKKGKRDQGIVHGNHHHKNNEWMPFSKVDLENFSRT